jgi:hypothetical protein
MAGRIQFSQRRLSLSHSMTGIAREDAHRDEAALGLIQFRRQIDREVAGPPTYNRRFSGNPLSAACESRCAPQLSSIAAINR